MDTPVKVKDLMMLCVISKLEKSSFHNAFKMHKPLVSATLYLL